MSKSLPVVAIAGATGHLGQYVAAGFLSPKFRPNFSQVILLKRASGTIPPKLTAWERDGIATVRSYDEKDLKSAIADVDILVNTIGSSGHAFKEKLLRAIPGTKVKVYFPSEFGVDHTVHDFSFKEWDKKKEHYKLSQEIIPDVLTSRIYSGLFLEDSIGPWFGFNTKSGKYEIVGSKESPVTFTSLEDVGKVVAQLASLPINSIPETVHISGDTLTISKIVSLMKNAGAGKIEVNELDLEQYKKKVMGENKSDPSSHLRFLIGEGKINHTETGQGNENYVVNPGEELWTWKKMADYAKETHGKPWADFPWPPK